MKGFRHSARSRLARAASLCALGAALVAAGPSSLAVAADPAPTPTVAPVPPPLPKITKLEPAVVSPLGDDFVSILGEQLQSVTGVTVDGAPVEFYDEGDGSLSFYTPPRARGVVQVRVISPAGTSIDNGVADDLTYWVGEGPRLDSISPASGPAGGGTTLTIRGDLSFALAVYFFPDGAGASGPATGNLQVISDEEIRVEAPALEPGRYRVEVVNPGGPSFGGTTLYYTAEARTPKITDLSPSVVFPIGDDQVFISGEDLDLVTDVQIDGKSVEFFDAGDGRLEMYTPAKPVGKYDVRLVWPGGVTLDNGRADDLWFDYGHGPGTESISPNQGPAAGGPWLTVRGSLRASEAVYFLAPDGTGALVKGADVEYVSSRELRVKAPALPPGRYAVEAADDSGFYPFDAPVYYTAVAAPQLLQVSPAWGVAGVGGLTVISGKNLAGTKSVRFGNKLALRFVVMGNRILAMAPPQPRGVYPVTVTTAGGTSAQTMAGRYIYVNLGAN